jgi:hypothetical protein
MSKKKKSLPTPSKTPFGRKRYLEESNREEHLMADQIARALAEGKLNEYLQNELPDSEYAVKLAEMMMGMTGIVPTKDVSAQSDKDDGKKPKKRLSEKVTSPQIPPHDVLRAARTGDIKGLTQLLEREHKKQHTKSKKRRVKTEKPHSVLSHTTPAVEKELIDQLIKIASDNNISLDWLVFRAVSQYVFEYQKTGKL